ncbi:hypothetical protein [Paenibacillus sp. BAC0078]
MIKKVLLLLLAAVLASPVLTVDAKAVSDLSNAPELRIRVGKIAYTNPAVRLTIYWAKYEQGLYKTVATPDQVKTYPVFIGAYKYRNVLFENDKTIYFLKYTQYPYGDIYKLEMPSKALTRLTFTGGIDGFNLKNDSIYYFTGSMTTEPGVYRMPLDGKKPAVRINPAMLDTGDKSYRYYFGSADMSLPYLYFPLLRQKWPVAGEQYIDPEEAEQDFEESVSQYEVNYSDYLGDRDADIFMFTERDEESGISYLHLYNQGKETVRKVKDWVIEPVDILHGWVYFTVDSEESDLGGLFAIRPDGTGLRQVGNGDLSASYYLGSVKGYLVFEHYNELKLMIVKE